ncbi:5S rRNA maturation endonuclease (ribonuclease M5) [Bacillus sp. OAE603]
MNIEDQRKVIIVEGTTDKRKIQSIIKEPVDIICTNGTVGTTKLDELAEMLDYREIYVLVDADEAGETTEKIIKKRISSSGAFVYRQKLS